MVHTTPQKISGYHLELTELTKGESFTITPLSPSLETADLNIAVQADNIFLLIGDTEIIGEETSNGFIAEVTTQTGSWQVLEGEGINFQVFSQDAIKGSANRGADYHFWEDFFILIVCFLVFILAVWSVL